MCNFYDLRQRHCVFCIFPHALLDGKKTYKQPQHPLHKLVPTHEPSNCLVKKLQCPCVFEEIRYI